MTDEVSVESGRLVAFSALRDLLQEWERLGRKSTTAGVRPELARLDPPVQFNALGFDSYADFLDAAESAGFIEKFRQPNGHWLLVPPGSVVKSDDVSSQEKTQRALRSDVWRAFVDWSDGLERYWDRADGCTIVVPVSSGGEPLWVSDRDRFPVVDHITQARQVEWMWAFAETNPHGAREILENALSDGSPRGEWQRTLSRLGLLAQWREYLRAEVSRVVDEWAAKHSIQQSALYVRQRTAASVGSLGRGQSGAATRARQAGADNSRGYTEKLRAAVHRAVDEMSFEELADLRIRAVHLLADS